MCIDVTTITPHGIFLFVVEKFFVFSLVNWRGGDVFRFYRCSIGPGCLVFPPKTFRERTREKVTMSRAPLKTT